MHKYKNDQIHPCISCSCINIKKIKLIHVNCQSFCWIFFPPNICNIFKYVFALISCQKNLSHLILWWNMTWIFLWDSPNYGILNFECCFSLRLWTSLPKRFLETETREWLRSAGISWRYWDVFQITSEWDPSEDADDVTVFSQQYLRNFFCVMMSSCSSSPLRTDEFELHLSKHAVCSISPFFKKGVFDYSSHGTGWHTHTHTHTHTSVQKHSFTSIQTETNTFHLKIKMKNYIK